MNHKPFGTLFDDGKPNRCSGISADGGDELERRRPEEVAGEAAAMAEAQTQNEDLPSVKESMEAETARMTSHNVKE